MKRDKVTRLARSARWAVGLWWYAGLSIWDIPELARLAYKRGLRDD